MRLFDLSGKKALLTGATTGLGYAMAEGLREARAAIGIIDIDGGFLGR
jgi:NAD(P)-dependent dehydrogenase (short-subunit alcohol dehydrogenase family)